MFMEAQEMSHVVVRKPPLSAKAILHQKYGEKACYKVEEVVEPVENDCPGLAIPQRGQVLYQCQLELPGCSVTSDKFTKKKDAEQSAAKMALEKLGIQCVSKDLTPEEALDELIMRISSLFTDKFLSAIHPMVSHFRAAIEREGDSFGMVPVSIIAACDVKVNNLCKVINPKAESEPLVAVSLVLKAARLSDSVRIDDQGLSIGKIGPYSSDSRQSLIDHPMCTNDILVEALYIPSSIEKAIETFNLKVSPGLYYMDEISQRLGVKDSSYILVSRTIGKASSETRFYFSFPRFPLSSPDSSPVSHLEEDINFRASHLSGQNICGGAVLATVGYTWKSRDLFYEDVSICTYYRMLLGMIPDGCYKLSREAILAARLPFSFTTKSNWRGLSPRDLLSMFCRHHRLMEPLFSIKEISSSETQSKTLEYLKQLKSSTTGGDNLSNGEVDLIVSESDRSVTFICEVKILSKGHDPIIEYLGDNYKKQTDAIQNAALNVLSWLNKYFQQSDMPIEELPSFAFAHRIHVYPERFSQEFASCLAVHGLKKNSFSICYPLPSLSMMQPSMEENGLSPFKIEGPESGSFPSPGSLVCISYTIALVKKEESVKAILESKDEFEFELGSSGVIDLLDACVSQMCVGQSAQFIVELPSRELILAAAGQSAKHISQLSLQGCFLEYFLTVHHIAEPSEDRMEQALFSPPLSKQRVEFAVGIINSSHATSLVDFGCGSGSLLDSLLEHHTSLENIVGVDISRRSLSRAAKILHSKLSLHSNHLTQKSMRSAVLYDGSITDYDSRMYGFDIGTCLEVIEHMEEDQASLFGNVVLSSFSPRLLIVSTPNYEYNPILQRTISTNREDDPEDRPQAAHRFRNHDHKFEWTRAQFEHWATELASRHCYSVEFGGVGGSANVEPGFASQIAVFRRSLSHEAGTFSMNGAVRPYEVVWEWSSPSRSAP